MYQVQNIQKNLFLPLSIKNTYFVKNFKCLQETDGLLTPYTHPYRIHLENIPKETNPGIKNLNKIDRITPNSIFHCFKST